MANITDHKVYIPEVCLYPWGEGIECTMGMETIHESRRYRCVVPSSIDRSPTLFPDDWLWVPAETYHSAINNTEITVPWTDNKMIVPMFDLETTTSPYFSRRSATEIEILRDMPMCHIEGWVHLSTSSQRLTWAARVLIDGVASDASRLQSNSYIRGTANQNITDGFPNFTHGQVFNFNGGLAAGNILTVEIILEGRSTVSSVNTVSGRCFWRATGKV